MSNIYTSTLATDFPNGVNHLIFNHINPTMTTNPIKSFQKRDNGTIELNFTNTLSESDESTIQSLISSYVYEKPIFVSLSKLYTIDLNIKATKYKNPTLIKEIGLPRGLLNETNNVYITAYVKGSGSVNIKIKDDDSDLSIIDYDISNSITQRLYIDISDKDLSQTNMIDIIAESSNISTSLTLENITFC